MPITTRQLLDLKPGTTIRATLRSGREIRGRVIDRPTLAQRGKPGPHRVDIVVRDLDNVAGDNASIWTAATQGRHTVSGDRVLSIDT